MSLKNTMTDLLTPTKTDFDGAFWIWKAVLRVVGIDNAHYSDHNGVYANYQTIKVSYGKTQFRYLS